MAAPSARPSLIDVRPGEWPRALALFGHLLLVIAALIILKSVASALFLRRLDPTALPYLYIGAALVVGLVASLATRVIDRVPRRLLILGTTLIFAVSLVFAWSELRRPPTNLVYPALYLWVEVYATVMAVQFWTFAGDVFTGRQGRRLFGLVAAGGVLGSILGGAVVSATAVSLGTANMLLVAAGLLLGIPPLLFLATSGGAPPARSARRERGERFIRESVSYFRTNRYPWLLAGIAFATVVATTLIDYQFKVFAAGAARTDAGLTKFFGQYNLVGGVVSLGLQLFVTSFVLGRFGILAAVLLTPVALMAGAAGVLLAPTLVAAFFLKLLDSALGHSIDLSGKQLLYVPLPERLAGTLQTFIDGVIARVGLGFTGALLLPLAFLLTSAELSWVTLGFLLLWVVLALRTRTEYRTALETALREEGFRPRFDPHARLDLTTLRDLTGALSSRDEGRVLVALDLLGPAGFDLTPYLRDLLEMPSPEVHRRALQSVAENGGRAALEVIVRTLGRLPSEVTAEAVEAMGRLAPEEATPMVRRFLGHDDPRVRGAAIRAVLSDGRWDADDLHALERFEEMLAESVGEREACRAEAARALADPHLSGYRYYLLHYLRDGSPEVQRAALATAAETRDPIYLPILFAHTLSRETREAAIHATASYGRELLPRLEDQFAAARGWKRLRKNLIRTACVIGTEDSAGFLLSQLKFANSWERYDLLKALNKIRERLPDVRLEPEAIQDAIFREAEDYYRNAHYLVQLGYPELEHLLLDALRERLTFATERVSRLLALFLPPNVILSIYRGVYGRNVRVASNAQELLEALIDRPVIKRLILPLFDDEPLQQTVAVGEERFAFVSRTPEAVLREIVEHSARWPRLCALYFAGDRGVQELKPLLEWTAREDADREARDAAALALRLLDGGRRADEGFMDTLVEKVLFLKEVEIFAGLSGEDLTEIAGYLREVRFPAGATIFEEHDHGDALYILVSGRVDLYNAGRLTETRERYASLGELSAVDGGPRTFTCVAGTDLLAFVIGEAELVEILHENPQISHSLLRVLAGRVRHYLQLELKALASAGVDVAGDVDTAL